MGRIYAIALNAYREAVRDRVLFGVVGLATASLLLGLSLAWLSLAEQVRIVVDHGVGTMSILSNLVAVFLGASFLYKEIELRTLYVILARPMGRWEFVVGKYLGIVTTVVVFLCVTASLLLVLLNIQVVEVQGPPTAGVSRFSHYLARTRLARVGLIALAAVVALVLARQASRVPVLARVRDAIGGAVSVLFALGLLAVSAGVAGAVAPQETRYILLSALLVAGEVVVIAAVAMLFSSFSTPFVTGALTFGVFLVGRSAGAMIEIRPRQMPYELRQLLRGIATVVPNLQLFVPSRDALLPREAGMSAGRFVASAYTHGALYAFILLVLAAALFRKRDLV